MKPSMRFAAAFALGLSMVTVGSMAHADLSIGQAREEFRRGIALEAAGDWEGALRVFKGVAQVKSTPQVRFHIAQAEEKTGDLVAALGSYRLASYEASEAKIKDVQVASEAAIRTIEPKIPKITIRRGAGAGVAKIVLDGRELGPATIGSPILVNPGPHHVEASAPGHESISLDVAVAASETKDVGIVLPESKVVGVGPVVDPGDKGDTATDTKPPPTSKVRIAGFVIGGAGLVSFGVAGVFFGIRQSAISDLNGACGATMKSCPASSLSTFNRGQTASTVVTGTLIGGAAGVVIGGIMILAAPKAKPKPAVGLALSAPDSNAGASLVGSF